MLNCKLSLDLDRCPVCMGLVLEDVEGHRGLVWKNVFDYTIIVPFWFSNHTIGQILDSTQFEEFCNTNNISVVYWFNEFTNIPGFFNYLNFQPEIKQWLYTKEWAVNDFI